jgi:hypothetical protein
MEPEVGFCRRTRLEHEYCLVALLGAEGWQACRASLVAFATKLTLACNTAKPDHLSLTRIAATVRKAVQAALAAGEASSKRDKGKGRRRPAKAAGERSEYAQRVLEASAEAWLLHALYPAIYANRDKLPQVLIPT